MQLQISCQQRNWAKMCKNLAKVICCLGAETAGQGQVEKMFETTLTAELIRDYNYDSTTIRRQRIARAWFYSTQAKNEHVNFSS